MNKLSFKGLIKSIQPRIRLTRSFDEASHTYLGYAIKIAGTIDNKQVTFLNWKDFAIGYKFINIIQPGIKIKTGSKK
jgi:hypothetical protein